ncbi:MAG: hypothetical protein CMI53_02210 [Parcubacteria group bacterium]|jgi:hypothetical protein|nr:hypothetical protein [Parcubacteria group bacterium]|tara:strand:- start:2368 stop:2664 length:297 start_codon:yes stop_codon:yes gene_type:complete
MSTATLPFDKDFWVLKGPRGGTIGYQLRTGAIFQFGIGWLQPPKPKKSAYDSLVPARAPDGECYNCGHWPNETRFKKLNGQAEEVVICSRCSTMMRPF